MAERLLDPANGVRIFGLAILVIYAGVPLLIYFVAWPNEAFLNLAAIAVVAVIAMWIGSRLPIFDRRFRPHAPRVVVQYSTFVGLTWCTFAVFVLVTFATAPSVPLLSALTGAGADTLSEERGAFLKGRVGWELALLYLSTVLVNTAVPYSIVLLYTARSRYRHLSAAVFFLFCISFLQKTLFLNLVLPILVYLALTHQLRGVRTWIAILGSLLVLVAATFISHGSNASTAFGSLTDAASYFSATHVPSAPVEYLVWRAVAVPIFTATDTLVVHAAQFRGEPLLGATSSLISMLVGVERVNLERYVFEYQFGSWNEIANSNAAFIIDGYVNFGWVGVLAFGVIVGQTFRFFSLSRDTAFRCLWPVFGFVLFSGPLIGMLLSNGFLLMLLFAVYFRVRRR